MTAQMFPLPQSTVSTLVNYVCGSCGARGCKLWRDTYKVWYQTTLRCLCCLTAKLNVCAKDITPEGDLTTGNRFRNHLVEKVWVPAIPRADSNYVFFAFDSMPSFLEEVQWWQSLPNWPTYPA